MPTYCGRVRVATSRQASEGLIFFDASNTRHAQLVLLSDATRRILLRIQK
jgi:hypothetical protein